MSFDIVIGLNAQPDTGFDIVIGTTPVLGFDVVIGTAPQPDAGFNIVIGDGAPFSALLEMPIPETAEHTVLLALVVRNQETTAPAGWTKVIDGEGDDGIFIDGYAREVDGSEDATVVFLSLEAQELQGSLLWMTGVTVADLVESVNHIEFFNSTVLASPVSSSTHANNTLLYVWAADSNIGNLLQPPGFETIATFTSSELIPRSILIATKTADVVGPIPSFNAVSDDLATGRVFALTIKFDPASVFTISGILSIAGSPAPNGKTLTIIERSFTPNGSDYREVDTVQTAGGAGAFSIDVPAGFYIVTFDDGASRGISRQGTADEDNFDVTVGGGYFTQIGEFMPKNQFVSNEDLHIVFPPFINRATGASFNDGSDVVTITVKRPNGTLLGVPPVATFDTDILLWTATISAAAFMEGKWMIKAVSNGANTQAQSQVLTWGDYVDDIPETRQAALGRWRLDAVSKKLFLYEDDGVTVFKEFDMKDSSGNPNVSQVFERDPA